MERAIERLRNNKILDLISQPLQPFADKIIQVCAVLVNFQSPIILEHLIDIILLCLQQQVTKTEFMYMQEDYL